MFRELADCHKFENYHKIYLKIACEFGPWCITTAQSSSQLLNMHVQSVIPAWQWHSLTFQSHCINKPQMLFKLCLLALSRHVLVTVFCISIGFWSVFIEVGSVFGIGFYPRDAMLARVIGTATCLSVCPSVCPSVTRRYCQNEESVW